MRRHRLLFSQIHDMVTLPLVPKAAATESGASPRCRYGSGASRSGSAGFLLGSYLLLLDSLADLQYFLGPRAQSPSRCGCAQHGRDLGKRAVTQP